MRQSRAVRSPPMSGGACRRSSIYTLPDDILATNSETQHYKFTEVDDQVVLVDPTKMRVIAVIRTKGQGLMHQPTDVFCISGLTLLIETPKWYRQSQGGRRVRGQRTG